MDIVAEVIDQVGRYATLRVPKQSGMLFIEALHDEIFDPPAKLLMTEESAEEYVRISGAESGEAVFPGLPVEEAGLAFLLLHLEETIETKVGPGTTVTVHADRIAVDGPRPSDDFGTLPPGQYVWTTRP
jgi:hypothetical protein